MKEIKNIAVIGSGNMGQQIAVSAAIAGFRVTCTDTNEGSLDKAAQFANIYLNDRVNKGKLTLTELENIQKRLDFVPNLANAVHDADFVIEAIIEKLELKRRLFASLDKLCPAHAILASNSSYFVSSQFAHVTQRPDKVCNMHFFNPALAMKLVEVVQGPHVSENTTEKVIWVAEKLGKTPVLLKKEIYGFLVNRILQATRSEAIKLMDMGVASFEDIDKAVHLGLGHPMGPFQLLDLTGIDLAYHTSMELYRESGDPADRPSPTIVEKYSKGEWGRKVKKGFYAYNDQ